MRRQSERSISTLFSESQDLTESLRRRRGAHHRVGIWFLSASAHRPWPGPVCPSPFSSLSISLMLSLYRSQIHTTNSDSQLQVEDQRIYPWPPLLRASFAAITGNAFWSRSRKWPVYTCRFFASLSCHGESNRRIQLPKPSDLDPSGRPRWQRYLSISSRSSIALLFPVGLLILPTICCAKLPSSVQYTSSENHGGVSALQIANVVLRRWRRVSEE